MKRGRQILWSILISSAIIGCGISDEEANLLIQQELQRKVDQLKKERVLICDKERDWRAEALADSIIRELRLNPLKENQYRPVVPPRPDYVPTDSAAVNSKRSVKPILKSSSDNR